MVNRMNISYDYYRTFYYVAKYRSFTQAANALMNSQPNITRSIKNLERELDCRLFIRSNRQVRLTEEGERLYRHVAIAFEQLLAGEEAIISGRGLNGGLLRIAATEVALHAFLLPVLKKYRSRYPTVHIKLINDSTPSAIADLQKGLADLAVVTTPTEMVNGPKEIPLMPVQEVAVCGSAFSRLADKPLSLEALSHSPMISLGKATATFDFYSRFFSEHGLVFTPDIEAATADQILPMVRANLGIGFVPEAFLREADIGTTVFRLRLSEPVPLRRVCLLLPEERLLGPAARELERMLVASRTEF